MKIVFNSRNKICINIFFIRHNLKLGKLHWLKEKLYSYVYLLKWLLLAVTKTEVYAKDKSLGVELPSEPAFGCAEPF